MKRIICLSIIIAAAALCGCRSALDEPPGHGPELFYAENAVPPNTYKAIKEETVTVTDNLFTDVNAEINRTIRRKAAAARADAVLIGEISRSKCACASCRSHGDSGGGHHVIVPITLLRLESRQASNGTAKP